MTRDEAVRMIQHYFRAKGVESPGLNENNLGGASVGEHQVYFEYLAAKRALKCSCLIYRFRDKPKAGVIEGFKAEEQTRTDDSGGGALAYEPVSKTLHLVRIYSESVSEEEFASDLQRLMQASDIYGDQVIERVAAKVFPSSS